MPVRVHHQPLRGLALASRSLEFIRPQRRRIACVVSLSLLLSGLGAMDPLLLKYLFDQLSQAGGARRFALGMAAFPAVELARAGLQDEATSALDGESERLIQLVLARLLRGRTAFVIAHRLSTVHGADRLVVLRDGRISEVGSHDELVAAGGYYAGLLETQRQGFLGESAAVEAA